MKKKQQKVEVNSSNYTAIFQEESEGGYSVTVPELPGCVSEGDIFEQAYSNIIEAIELMIEDEPEIEKPQTRVRTFIVPVKIDRKNLSFGLANA